MAEKQVGALPAAPTTAAFGDVASPGAVGDAPALSSHRHGMPASSLGVSVKAYGAKGDGQYFNDAAITAATTALAAATSHPFVLADVGKVIVIDGAGTAGAAFSTTISGYVDASHVTLAAAAVTTVAASQFIFGTDDTVAIQAGIDAVYALLAGTSGETLGSLLFPLAIYLIGGALRTAPTVGAALNYPYNAQLALPARALSAPIRTLVLRGDRPMAAAEGQANLAGKADGSLLVSTLTGQVYSAVNGSPAMLAGPSDKSTNVQFTNLYVVIDRLGFLTPGLTTISAVDLIGCAAANVPDIFAGTLESQPATGTPGQNTHPWVFGLRMPGNNNDMTDTVGTAQLQSYPQGFGIGEHTVADNLNIMAANVCVALPGGAYHAMLIKYLDVIGYNYGVAYVHPQTGVGPVPSRMRLDVLLYDAENAAWTGVEDIHDPTSLLYGNFRAHAVTSSVGIRTNGMALNGALFVSIVDVNSEPLDIRPGLIAVSTGVSVPSGVDVSLITTGWTVENEAYAGSGAEPFSAGVYTIKRKGRYLVTAYYTFNDGTAYDQFMRVKGTYSSGAFGRANAPYPTPSGTILKWFDVGNTISFGIYQGSGVAKILGEMRVSILWMAP